MTEASLLPLPSFNGDHAALLAALADGTALCTIVNIDGSFSRRLGAQLAVYPDGTTIGSLSDGCLERELATRARAASEQNETLILRFGSGSPFIDFRLPCGSGLEILIDPAPDKPAIEAATNHLTHRTSASIKLPLPSDAPDGLLGQRCYIPNLRILAFGEGPELASLTALAQASGIEIQSYDKNDKFMALGRAPEALSADPWTAVVLLFHDHEWERALLGWALGTPVFYIGAQGGEKARSNRKNDLLSQGFDEQAISRVVSPTGLIKHARNAEVLALSVLAEIVAKYEALHPHA